MRAFGLCRPAAVCPADIERREWPPPISTIHRVFALCSATGTSISLCRMPLRLLSKTTSIWNSNVMECAWQIPMCCAPDQGRCREVFRSPVREAPPGLGSPQTSPNGSLGGGDTPTLNALIGPGVQVDLSILGSIPLPTGTAVPNLDPEIAGSVGWNHTSDIQNSVFVPGLRSINGEQTTANVAYQQGFTTGGSVDVFFNNSRFDMNSPLLLYNPSTSSSVGIDFTQPLLRGFGFGVNRRYMRIANNNRKVSNAVFRQQVIATVGGLVRLTGIWSASAKMCAETRRNRQCRAVSP